MNKDLLVAQRYARALFELACETKKDELFEAELESLSAALKASPEIEKFLANPSIRTDEKGRFLEKLYQQPGKASEKVLLDFFKLLFKKHRFYLIHDIADSFKRIADVSQGQAVAELHSASMLKPEAARLIVERLERKAGVKITAKNLVDPSLIGGVVVKMNNKVIDGSVSNSLRQIKKALTKSQSI